METSEKIPIDFIQQKNMHKAAVLTESFFTYADKSLPYAKDTEIVKQFGYIKKMKKYAVAFFLSESNDIARKEYERALLIFTKGMDRYCEVLYNGKYATVLSKKERIVQSDYVLFLHLAIELNATIQELMIAGFCTDSNFTGAKLGLFKPCVSKIDTRAKEILKGSAYSKKMNLTEDDLENDAYYTMGNVFNVAYERRNADEETIFEMGK